MNNIYRNLTKVLSRYKNAQESCRRIYLKNGIQNTICSSGKQQQHNLLAKTIKNRQQLSLLNLNNASNNANPFTVVSLAICSYLLVNFLIDDRVYNAEAQEEAETINQQNIQQNKQKETIERSKEILQLSQMTEQQQKNAQGQAINHTQNQKYRAETSQNKQCEDQKLQRQRQDIMACFQKILRDLNNNSALLTDQCPQQVKNYLQLCGVRIISLSQQLKDYSDTQKYSILSSTPCLYLKNSRNQIKKFQIESILCQINKNQSTDNIKKKQYSARSIQLINNFLNPPYEITSYQQYLEILSTIKNQNQFMIVALIPNQAQYKSRRQLQDEFCQLKYTCASNQANYCIIRDEQLGKKIKINTHKINKTNYVQMVYMTTVNSGMETSTIINGRRYSIKKVNQCMQTNKMNKHKLDYHTNIYINEINIDQNMHNFIWKHRITQDSRKILLVSTRQNSKEFQAMLKKTMTKVAKIMNKQILVVYSQNQKLLQKYFQVVPDQFATVRLFDCNKIQPPIVVFPQLYSKPINFYSRKKFEGGFTVENLCRFVKDQSQNQQYYERKNKLTSIPSIISLNPQKQNIDDLLVLHWKQGCRSCQLTHQYLQQIQKIQQQLKNCDPQQKIKLTYKYEIENPDIFTKIRIARLNILNEQSHSQYKNEADHDLTPQITYHPNKKSSQNNIKNHINISQILSRLSSINQNNSQIIHQQIITEMIDAIIKAQKKSTID